MQGKLEQIHLLRGDEKQSQGGDITQVLRGIVCPERLHGHIVQRDSETICNPFGKKLEYLPLRFLVVKHKPVIKRIEESDLTESGIIGRRGHPLRGANDPRDRGGNANRWKVRGSGWH